MPDPRTMSDFVSFAHELDVDPFRDAFGDGFLVITDGRDFQMKSRFQPTSRIDLHALAAVSKGAPMPESLVFLLQRDDESVYSFISVGRTNNCDVTLPDESVSKLHAIVKEIDGTFYIQDADSQNGTTLDDDPVPVRGQGNAPALVPGVDVCFGLVRMQFVDARELRNRAGKLPKTVATA